MSRLMRSLPLTLQRDSAEGYWSEEGDWVEGGSTPVDIFCSIQPFQKGTTRVVLPSGITTSDALTIYTKSEVKTADQYDFSTADRATIDSKVYIATNIMNWSRHKLRTANYEVVFIREDKLKNGGL